MLLATPYYKSSMLYTFTTSISTQMALTPHTPKLLAHQLNPKKINPIPKSQTPIQDHIIYYLKILFISSSTNFS